MKKTIIPSKGLFALSIVCFPLTALFICFCPEMISDTINDIINLFSNPSLSNIFTLLSGIVFLLIVFLATALFVYATLEIFLFAGRPIIFSEEMISIGYIKKKNYYKKDITGIGVAPWLEGNKGQGIYIAFGDYNESDFSKFGIMTVWELVEFRKVLPKVVEFLHRTGHKYLNTDDTSNIQVFDGLVWMTYTEENFRFLQNWLGSKFYEITQ